MHEKKRKQNICRRKMSKKEESRIGKKEQNDKNVQYRKNFSGKKKIKRKQRIEKGER